MQKIFLMLKFNVSELKLLFLTENLLRQNCINNKFDLTMKIIN